MRPASIRTQTSSGGVIFRRRDGRVEVALVGVKNGVVWSLPKGLVEKGEEPQDTAVREVREETGLTGRAIGKIGDIAYWYYIKDANAKCRKTVHFYLLEYESGNTDDHNWEVDSATWVPLDEAVNMVSYKGDREIVGKAREMILGGYGEGAETTRPSSGSGE